MTPDREKVIKGLEQCISADKTCFGCPYDGTNCTITLSADALALLKEQETVEHAKEILCANGWEKLRFPEGTIGKWDDPEIVRCKDCKQGEQSVLPNRHLWCRIHEFYREPDWFCADGERK